MALLCRHIRFCTKHAPKRNELCVHLHCTCIYMSNNRGNRDYILYNVWYTCMQIFPIRVAGARESISIKVTKSTSKAYSDRTGALTFNQTANLFWYIKHCRIWRQLNGKKDIIKFTNHRHHHEKKAIILGSVCVLYGHASLNNVERNAQCAYKFIKTKTRMRRNARVSTLLQNKNGIINKSPGKNVFVIVLRVYNSRSNGDGGNRKKKQM